ncbi:MAG TPA: DHH family phosphoesterase [Lachnospiraceae bacterium]|nr:DHH family phosphoesterase [Lachnospiraceae bacterium]
MSEGTKNDKRVFIIKLLKVLVAVIAIEFLVLKLFSSPVLVLFLVLTVIIAVVLMVLIKLVFGNEFVKDEETYGENCINDFADLGDIKRVINLPLPFAVTDKDRKVIVYNNRFAQLFNKDITGEQMEKLLGSFDEHINKQSASIDSSIFDVYCSKILDKERDKELFSVCLVDISEREKLKKQAENERTVTGLIFVDNYEEVMEVVDESVAPVLSALIDKKLNTYISSLGGIIKKYEKDRYIFAISTEALEKEKEKKFDILNEIKELRAGEHISVTLSMGVGISYESLDFSMKNARNALDLALGRGGDQSIIKEGEKYLFFGGKSSEVSHNARIRARIKADALEGVLADASEVFVMGHRIADFDSIGSAIGIYRIARDLGKNCYIVIDEVSKGIRTIYNMVKQNEDYRGMFIGGQEALEIISEKTLLVIVDTYIPNLVENEDLLDKAKKVVVFDHHRKSADFIEKAVLTYHEPYASSTSELVTEVIRHLGDRVRLKDLEADALLAGITVDTKSFGIKAGAITFESAAYLRRNGADSTRVKQLFRNEFNEFKIKAITVGNAEIYMGGVIISVCPSDEEGASVISAQAADELLNIVGIKAAIVVCRVGNDVHVSGRSFGEVNVQVLMEKVGGGGHQTMAGARLENISTEDAVIKLKKAVDEYLEEDK